MESNKPHMSNTKTLTIVQVAMMAAITALVTMTIRIPTYTGYTHLGDSMIFLSVILFGKNKAMASSALGMFLADLLGGYLVWSPFTLVIKGIMALIAGIIAFRGSYNGDNTLNNIFAFIVAGIWMVAGYYISGAFITRYVLSSQATMTQSLILALKEIPANSVEVLVGIILAIPLGKLIKKSNFF